MIFLDQQTRPYLERIIKKRILENDKDFIAKRIQKMLEADRERLDEINGCKHKEGSFIGHKTCCVYCGGYFKDGQGEEWTLIIPKDKK